MVHNRFDVWAVVKDPGGMSGVLPVVEQLERGDHSVLLIANGKARDLISGRDFIARDETDAAGLLAEFSVPKVLLTSLDSGGGVGRDLVPVLRSSGTKAVALQDTWASRLSIEWAAPEFRPDRICVNDEIDKGLTLAAWPEYNADQVLITGYPALDKYARTDVATEGAKARRALGLSPDTPLVLFAGQGFSTAHALQETVAALNALRADCYFMPRPHPRMKYDFVSEVSAWQEALGQFRGRLVVDWFGQCTMVQLICAAALRGVIVSMHSTTLIEAACARAPAISVMFPENRAAMRAETPELDEFPVLSGGSAAKAQTQAELQALVCRALGGGLDLRMAQEQQFPLDGGNAARVARVVVQYL